ncbi:MAG: ABC transporter permease [Pseudomonadota bacterium]
MHRDRLALLMYLAALLAATLVHDPVWLAGGLAGVLLVAGREALAILRRAILGVLVFNAVVSLSYAALAWWQDSSPWATLLRLNLRVLLLTALSFLFMARVNLFRALDFSRDLTFALGLAYSQALVFRRAQQDFQQALASRSLRRPGLVDRYRASAAAASWFIEKAVHAARQSALALRSRGFFHD